MRTRRRQQRRRIIVIASVLLVAIVVVVFLWRPWEAGVSDAEEAIALDEENLEERPDTAETSSLPSGEEPPVELSQPEDYAVLFWSGAGGETAVRSASYELSQLGQSEYSELPVALSPVLPNAVYYYGQSDGLAGFAGDLSERLNFPEPIRVDLSIVLGADIQSLLGAVPSGLTPLPGLAGLNVEVLNGCGIGGVAHQTATLLEQLGLTVVDARNADQFTYERTSLSCVSSQLDAAEAVKESLKLPGTITGIKYDVQVVLGGG